MAQSRPTKNKESLRQKSVILISKEKSGDTSPLDSFIDNSSLEDTDSGIDSVEVNKQRPKKSRGTSSITLRSTYKSKLDSQPVPDVEETWSFSTTHSNMKTKHAKEELDKSIDEETIIEPKTRARKKATDLNDEDKTKPSQDEPKTSKETKKSVPKPRAVVKKRPLGIRKTLRSKKAAVVKEKVKRVIRQTVTRGRKAALKTEPDNSQDKETVPLIPASEIKKEPLDDTTPNSRSSSPKTASRRQRLSSDIAMMKTMLTDSPGSLTVAPRTSPYSMRSERSNSPSLFEGKNLRSGKPRKMKSNLLNEVVMKEQKKRRRLLSDSKNPDAIEGSEECKKLKRGRSCSRDGSEVSKCSDNTESDLSLSETLNDTDSKELNKKFDKSKTDLDVDIENNIQISTIEKVPSLNVDSKIDETKLETETSSIINEEKTKSSLKRSTSLDSDNNNSNRVKLENLNSSDKEDKLLVKTENNTLFEARSSILSSMSKSFNSKEMSKNIRKARRGRKVAAESKRPNSILQSNAKNCISSTLTNDTTDDKHETLETLSKEIDDLINNLDQNIDRDHEMAAESNIVESTSDQDQIQTKSVSKFYGIVKPLSNLDDNSIMSPETPVKDKDAISSKTNESTPSKHDESENIRLHYEEDSVEKSTDGSKVEITYKCNTVASIDKLMDRLKEFEEFDKRRQRQESESKSNDGKPMMVTNDVVLIPKSGADIKPLKDIQSVRSPERPIEKENVLSCFENNSAISIVKRDQVRKSVDIELPNSVTLIKRNSVSARKESTSSNHSRESDAISIFEKSLGKDVTLTEIRKSVDKSAPAQIDLHQFATLHPNNPTQSLGCVVLDSSQISITPRVIESKINNNDVKIINKRKSRESSSRKSSESIIDEEKLATIEKIKSPSHQIVTPAISITATPIAIKSPEATPLETEALPPPVENIKSISEGITLASEITKVEGLIENAKVEVPDVITKLDIPIKEKVEDTLVTTEKESDHEEMSDKLVIQESCDEIPEISKDDTKIPIMDKIPEEIKTEAIGDIKPESQIDSKPLNEVKPTKVPGKPTKSTRNSTECQAGPSNALNETPESQKRKENILRTLGLLTHKAAKEAKIEKLKEKERIYGPNYSGMMSNKNKSAKSVSGDYTGTLKTVIKLNRSTGERDKKKHRSSLKMTFQKSKYRSGKPVPEVGEAAAEDDAYYTIERREGVAGATADGGHRKTHYSNRLNHHGVWKHSPTLYPLAMRKHGNTDYTDTEAAPEPAEPKETLNLVIPEKASSFSIHPGRLCKDQCVYCGGKFGLFDTPCHIAQIKSSERQKKVLDNEEKLTIDSCLCDACYRHVDRRANCPSYRKRPLIKQPEVPTLPSNAIETDKPASPPLEEESEEEAGGGAAATGRVSLCHTEGCVAAADHSIRRKWLIKMRTSVNKVLKLKCDYPGLHTIPLCGEHHRALAPLMACALCRRRLTKHHNLHFVHHGYVELNPWLAGAGVPVRFVERPVLCKGCRYYCSLLPRPLHNTAYAAAYRRKLLQIYNIEVPPESELEPEDPTAQECDVNGKQRKKQRNKSKQRKSTEPEKDSESSERTNDSTPEKKMKEEIDMQKEPPLEEDIESLISSNKILVPGANKTDSNPLSDGSEAETVCEIDMPLLHVDKQTELQYLLQKQNNPAQFLQNQVNLTQKQRNILKLQNASGIQKPSQNHKINDKNAKRIHKLGQIVLHKDKTIHRKEEMEIFEEKSRDGIPVLKNISLNDECTIETIPNKRPADINTLKNKWQMSESFSQVKKNLSELSKKLPAEKEPKKLCDVKYSNPVKRLETNPSISVRELFPGEEEMNLQCNIEFNNVKGVTPEGWEKCNTMIQYDTETKKLWNELQRPYGNQSSFLRHLILLEKYFRSGDLVLSHNASPHAANYSDSVQSRLRAYDNIVSDAPRRSEPAISLIEFRKKPSINGKSLLKSNQNDTEKDPKVFMPPPGIFPKPKAKEKSKTKQLPPELIAINTPNAQGRKSIQNVLHNIQQLVKGVSASDPTEVAAAPLPVAKFEPPKEKKETPKSDTPKKSKTTSKPWRPTLMPITAENLARIGREPTQVAVDGRLLPSLVQVMSSGKRYHITLQDYNKMCVMRREKLQQLQDGPRRSAPAPAPAPGDGDGTLVTELQPSAMLGNGGTLVQSLPPEDRPAPDLSPIGTAAATILKNVGLKNITIAPIAPKTATVTSQTLPAPAVTSPSLLVTSTPIKIPQLGPAVSITTETMLTPNLPVMTSHMIMPKIPKSLTVIPQTVVASVSQSVVVTSVPQSVVVASVPQGAGGASPAGVQGAADPRP